MTIYKAKVYEKKTILMWRVGFYSRRLIQIYLLPGIYNNMY